MLKHPAGLLFLAFLALYLLTMGGHLYSPDEEIMFLTTRSLAEHGSLAIEPPADFGGFATRRGLNRREYGQYGVGQPLLAVPFYMLGRALADHFGDRPIWFSGLQSRGHTPRQQWERFGVSLFNQFIAALLVALLFALAHDLTGDKTAAALTAVLYGAGTMAWVHSKPFFSETLATVMVFSAFSLLVRARLYHRPRWFTLAGCAAGYALLTRLDSLFAFPALGLLLLWPDEYITYIPPSPRPGEPEPPVRLPFRFNLRDLLFDRLAWQRIGRFAPPVALACVIILGLNWCRYGSPLSTGYEDQPEGVQFINPLLVGLYGFFFSVGKGIFFFSPPLVLFCFAIRRFVRLSAPAGWAVVVLLASLLLIQSKWINWAGGWCWGPRHVFMVHVFFALPICALLMAADARGARGLCGAAGLRHRRSTLWNQSELHRLLLCGVPQSVHHAPRDGALRSDVRRAAAGRVLRGEDEGQSPSVRSARPALATARAGHRLGLADGQFAVGAVPGDAAQGLPRLLLVGTVGLPLLHARGRRAAEKP